jgi:UDP-N-acetyl-D-mannosaminuronate dehydrogenase
LTTVSHAASLQQKIEASEIRAGVIGLGYVGLPLAVEFAKAGYDVVGLDIDQRKVETLNRGRSYIPDVPDADVAALAASGRLRATTDFSAIAQLDTVNICVPTPLHKTKDPDLSYSDPHVPFLTAETWHGNQPLRSLELDGRALADFDAVVITTDHAAFDYQLTLDHGRGIVDTPNAAWPRGSAKHKPRVRRDPPGRGDPVSGGRGLRTLCR